MFNPDEDDDPFADDYDVKLKAAAKWDPKGCEPLGTRCPVCRELQYETPSGALCINGHGGADPMEEPCQHRPGVDQCDNLCAEEYYASQNPTTTVIYNDETAAEIDEETGEILRVLDAPPDTWTLSAVAEWLGEKLTWLEGKIAGTKAERQVWLDKADKQYTPKLNHYERLHKWLTASYTPMFRTYAEGVVFDGDGKPKGRSKTVKMGLLKMNFTTTRARTDVIQSEATIDLLRAEIAAIKAEGNKELAEQLAASIKVTRSLLKSALPVDYMIPLEPEEAKEFASEGVKAPESVRLKDYLEKKGLIHFYEGGEQEFHLG